MTRAVRVRLGRAPRGCARLRAVLLVIVVLAGAVPRTLAMRGAFASAFRSAERTLQEKGLLPLPAMTRRRPRPEGRIPTRRRHPKAGASSRRTRMPTTPGRTTIHPSRPPSASSAPRRASSTIAQTRLARRGARRPSSARRSSWTRTTAPRSRRSAARIRRARASTSTTPSRWTSSAAPRRSETRARTRNSDSRTPPDGPAPPRTPRGRAAPVLRRDGRRPAGSDGDGVQAPPRPRDPEIVRDRGVVLRGSRVQVDRRRSRSPRGTHAHRREDAADAGHRGRRRRRGA